MLYSTSQGQGRWDGLERKHDRHYCGGLDMHGRKMMDTLGVLRMELSGQRKRRLPKRRCMGAMRDGSGRSDVGGCSL